MSKIILILFVAITFISFISYGTLRYYGFISPAVKVTNPADPSFKKDNFNFYDYPYFKAYPKNNKKQDSSYLENFIFKYLEPYLLFQTENTIKYYKSLFPIGVTKKEVEKVLVDAGAAKSFKSNDKDYTYFYSRPKRFLVPSSGSEMVIYDENYKLINFRLNGNFLYQRK